MVACMWFLKARVKQACPKRALVLSSFCAVFLLVLYGLHILLLTCPYWKHKTSSEDFKQRTPFAKNNTSGKVNIAQCLVIIYRREMSFPLHATGRCIGFVWYVQMSVVTAIFDVYRIDPGVRQYSSACFNDVYIYSVLIYSNY